MSFCARMLLPAGIFLVALAAFLPALDAEFLNWDDDINFLGNSGFRGLGWPQLKWMWTATLMGHYIPLTWMSLGLNYALGGMDPWGYHLGNMLLHAANAVVVYFVARRLLIAAGASAGAPGSWGAAFAALVFGVHPLRVESVAWITERRDVLCALFFLLAVWTYLISVDRVRRPGWRAASVVLFAAALLAKAQAVPLPLALLLLDAYPLRRIGVIGWRRSIAEKLPYFALSLAAGVVAIAAIRHAITFTDYAQYGPGARLAMMAYAILFYPSKWLWPMGLSPLYELPARVDPLAGRFLEAIVVLALATAALVALRRRWPAGLAVWSYSALMVLPVVGPLHAGNQLAHDRYSYLSGLGFAVLAGGALAWALGALARGSLRPLVGRAVACAAGVVVLGLGSATLIQTSEWRDSGTLWAMAVDQDPECAVCLNNLAQALASQGNLDAAEHAFRRSLALRERPMTRNNLGGVLQVRGQFEAAEREYRLALRMQPDLREALANLGDLYVRQGRTEEARPLFLRLVEIAPDFPRAGATLRALREEGGEQVRVGRGADAEGPSRGAPRAGR